MDAISKLKEEAKGLESNERDLFKYRLRKNSVLTWADEYLDIIQYLDILSDCNVFSTLSVESGIVKVMPEERYLSHKFVPHVNRGLSLSELIIILKYKVNDFIFKYGDIKLNINDIELLKQIIYKYNNTVHNRLDLSDKKLLIHLESSAIVLYYLLTSKVILTNLVNGWCSLEFTVNNSKKEYCTIFTVDEIVLLEKVNKSIQVY